VVDALKNVHDDIIERQQESGREGFLAKKTKAE
jgi:hypothetical protein